MTKVIQVPMESDLVAALDALAEVQHAPRAALIRDACQRYVADARARALDAAYEDGYRRVPEEPAVGEAQAAMVSAVLPAESW